MSGKGCAGAAGQRAAAPGGRERAHRQLYRLPRQADLADIAVSPRLVYADANKPDLVDGFIRKTFTAMIQGVRDAAVEAGMIRPDLFDAGIRALYRTADPDGVFCYTFFNATARRIPLSA